MSSHRVSPFVRTRLALTDFGGALWLCLFPTFAVSLVVLLITLVPQGIEIAESLTLATRWVQFLTALCYIYFVLTVTFAASSALQDGRRPTIISRYIPWWIFGVGVFSAIPVCFPRLLTFGIAFLLLIVSLVLPPSIAMLLKVPLKRWAISLYPAPVLSKLEVGFFAFGSLIAIAICVWPVAFPRALGAVGVVYAAFGFWTFTFSMLLVVWPRRAGLPALTLVAVAIVLICAQWNDNHKFRGCQHFMFPTRGGDVVPEDHCTGGWSRTLAVQTPQPLMQHVRTWMMANCRPLTLNDPRSCPIIFVAAEGGGSRAAYWTAQVLQRLDENSHHEFFKHLFAISSVSGGTLGSVAFLGAEFRNQSSREKLREYVGSNFLSPILAALLFPEVLQRFSPIAFDSLDRSHAFELGLERSWYSEYGDNAFAEDFMGFWTRNQEQTGPAMFINSTNVETGLPFVISNIDVPSSDHPRSYYAFDKERLYHISSLPLSAAVHLSGRFSYVNPPATLDSRPSDAALASGGDKCTLDLDSKCAHAIVPWGQLVDGGYFDNSGSQTLSDVILATQRYIERWQRQLGAPTIVPQFIVITILNSADVGTEPDPELDYKLIPDRPREPSELYLMKLRQIALRQSDWQRTGEIHGVHSSVWDRYVAESDLSAPLQASFMVSGAHSVADQLALSRTTGQLSIQTIGSCFRAIYPGLKENPDAFSAAVQENRMGLASLVGCTPNITSIGGTGLADTLGCPIDYYPSHKFLPGGNLARYFYVISRPEHTLSCIGRTDYYQISFARIETEIAESDAREQFARPALGWALSARSKAALDNALLRGFPTGRFQFGYQRIIDNLATYSKEPFKPAILTFSVAGHNVNPIVYYGVKAKTRISPFDYASISVSDRFLVRPNSDWPTCPATIVNQTLSQGAAAFYRLTDQSDTNTGRIVPRYCYPRP